MKVGALVKSHIGNILRYCERDPVELSRLMNAEYSRKNLHIRWPFFAEVRDITSKDYSRYWQDRYVVGEKNLRVCSQWYERDWEPFCQYLLSKGIIEANHLPHRADPAPTHPRPPISPTPDDRDKMGNSRFRSIAIGDGQNAVIRFILSKLGQEVFDEDDWKTTKSYFDNRCAYCCALTDLEMDHAIPINKTKLGEHRLGNVIPSCKNCNRDKNHRDFVEYLGDDQEKIARIQSYMKDRKYVPLGDNRQVKLVLEQAYREVAPLANRYIAIINGVLAEGCVRDDVGSRSD